MVLGCLIVERLLCFEDAQLYIGRLFLLGRHDQPIL